jgi:hypothetical protein
MSERSFAHTAIRWGGVANIFGGILVAAAYLLHPHHATPAVVMGGFWLLVHVLFVFSLLFGIFGLFAMIAYHGQQGGRLGFTGFLMAATGLILIFGLNYFETFIIPVVAREAPAFVDKYGAGETAGAVAYIFPLTGVLFIAGYVCLSIDFLRFRSLNHGGPILTIIGVLVFGIGLSGFLPMFVVKAGAVIFALGLIWLGRELWKSKKIRSETRYY